MLRIMLIALLFAINKVAVFGQQEYDVLKLAWNVQANLGITTPNSPYGYGLAFGFGADMPISEVLTVSASLGYSRLLTKDTSPIADYDFIHLTAKVKVFPTDMPLYVVGLTGTGFGIRGGSKPSLIYGGGFGYVLSGRYDLNFKFEGYQQSRNSTTYQPFNGVFAMGLGYRF